jgi:ATP-dependent Clp protease protease subunit
MSMTIYKDGLPIILIDRHIGVDPVYGNGITGSDFVRELNAIENMAYPKCDVWINSVGGSVMDGMDIYNAITNSKVEITTKCVGIAASIAGVIFQAGDKRVMNDYSLLMMHNPFGGDDNALQAVKSSLVTMLSTRCSKSELQISNMMEKETWLDSSECKEIGLCDEIEISIQEKVTTENKSAFALYNKLKSVVNKLIEEPKKPNMKTLKNFLNLSEDASEESILKEVQSLKDSKEALSKSLKDTQDSLKEKEDDLKKIQDDKYEAEKLKAAEEIVNKAESEGRIEKDAVAGFVNLAKGDLEGVKSTLATMPVKKTANLLPIPNNQPEGRSGWDFDKWQKEDPKGLENMLKNHKEAYELLFNSWKEKFNTKNTK